MNGVEKYICIFFVYAIAGWFMETFRGWFRTKKFVNRGFLIGPYLPVYGWGVVLITLCLEKYINDIPILFGMSIILCGILEYFTSWIMEKLFKARWWDYHNRKFNINGRICLETLIPFGILGTVLLKYANPFILGLLEKVPSKTIFWILLVMISIFTIDTIISLIVVLNFKKTAKNVEENVAKDSTEEMSNMVKEVTTEKAKEIVENMSDKLDEAKNSINDIPRIVNINIKLAKEKASFTGKKIYDSLKASEAEVKARKDKAVNSIKEMIEKSQTRMKETTLGIKNEIKARLAFTTSKEFTEFVKEKFLEKSWLNRRLARAFPNLQLKPKTLRLKDKND